MLHTNNSLLIDTQEKSEALKAVKMTMLFVVVLGCDAV
jgi:hypothetical protein